MRNGVINIIECGIEIGYREWMYNAQVGMFAIQPLDHKNLKRLHGMALGIPRIDDNVYKCELIPGKLFTNASGKAPDWVLSQEGEGSAKVFFPDLERTGPPVGGRQHSTARALPGGRARRTRAECCGMNRCLQKRF